MINPEQVPLHSPSIVTRKTGNEYVLVPVTDNIADMDSVYTLNETGAFIWDCIDGKRNIAGITEMITREYEIDREAAMADLTEFIERMKYYLILL
jgi:hypothetical protein